MELSEVETYLYYEFARCTEIRLSVNQYVHALHINIFECHVHEASIARFLSVQVRDDYWDTGVLILN